MTLPMMGNYGGMLQAYALMQSCVRLGMAPTLVEARRYYSPRRRLLTAYLYASLKKLLPLICLPRWERERERMERRCLARRFIRRFFPRVRYAAEDCVTDLDFFITGSDQIWRCAYTRGPCTVPYFFLNFVSPQQRASSISYAASFGTKHWEGSPGETQQCRALLRQFKAVSVRESEGVALCESLFGVGAVQMPDPTLLALPEDYQLVINEASHFKLPPYFAAYVLDMSEEKAVLLKSLEAAWGVPCRSLMPVGDSIACVAGKGRYPTVGAWLYGIQNAKCVITDSFHGCIFSLVYRKPFVCLGNEGRGLARFKTLLGTFGLEHRLVLDHDPEQIEKILHSPVNWDRVAQVHEQERERGMAFLRQNLCS